MVVVDGLRWSWMITTYHGWRLNLWHTHPTVQCARCSYNTCHADALMFAWPCCWCWSWCGLPPVLFRSPSGCKLCDGCINVLCSFRIHRSFRLCTGKLCIDPSHVFLNAYHCLNIWLSVTSNPPSRPVVIYNVVGQGSLGASSPLVHTCSIMFIPFVFFGWGWADFSWHKKDGLTER